MGHEFLGLAEIIVRVSANLCGVSREILPFFKIYIHVLELKNFAYSAVAKCNTAIMLEDYKMIFSK